MISKLLKRVMSECNLRQVDLAEVLGVSLSRVKAMTSGRVKNLTREENEALIDKLGIRAEWLVTGDGPMLEETEDQFADRIQAINRMNVLIAAMPVREHLKMRLSALITGDPLQDGPLITRALLSEAQGLDFISGEPVVASPSPSNLPPRLRALLDNYDHADEVGKKVIEGAADLAAQSRAAKRSKAA